jgi:hypothetical protein
MNDSRDTRNFRPARWMSIAGLLVIAAIGCVQWREFSSPPSPLVSEWRALVADLRTFEHTIGFSATKNFLTLTGERESFPFCGQASRYTLPYSYEDPSIRWADSLDEAQCHAASADADVFFGTVEAMGEIGTPVTPSMLKGKLDRFVYLVIHEDCHDQFDLPYGIEEALCNVIAYHAMDRFSSGAYRWYSRENRAIKSYTGLQSTQTRATIAHYGQLEMLYGRFHRAEISAEYLLNERARVFASAERALALDNGTMNNVVLANYMTYSRHYPFLERTFAVLGRDLARTVEFFRHVDRVKPTKAEVMRRAGIREAGTVEFVRAYETAVAKTIAQELAEWRRTRRLGGETAATH